MIGELENEESGVKGLDRAAVCQAIQMLTYGITVVHYPKDPLHYAEHALVRIYCHSLVASSLVYVRLGDLHTQEVQLDLLKLKRVSTRTRQPPQLEGSAVHILRLVFEDSSLFCIGCKSRSNFETLLEFFQAFVAAKAAHPLR